MPAWMRKIHVHAALAAAALAIVGAALYFTLPGNTHAWHPDAVVETAPALVHAHALDRAGRFAQDVDRAPVALAVEPAGSLYAGTVVAAYAGGNIVRVSTDGLYAVSLGNIHGRPRDVAVTSAGDVYITDAEQGLIASTRPAGFARIKKISDVAGVAVSPDGGPVYLTRVSGNFSWNDPGMLRFAHDTSGSLLRYDPHNGHIETVASDFAAPHGVALGPGGDYALVVETNTYRILRVWLKGPRTGQREVFADGLPGFATHITFNGIDRFWVSVPTARMPEIDALATHSAYRRVLLRLPNSFRPHFRLRPQGLVLAFDLDGQRIAELQGSGASPYAPVNAAAESGNWLWLASDRSSALARIALVTVLPAQTGAPPAH
ncbi:MAG: hypothetical protein EPN72_02695 [Nevskiaceae bacterium]|nr:MAG: hypothetical protein EPN63_11325 [Nevskiaceae bacterium]TBR74464.1 MAG: hypothetical protein EPN72_02695 [Nevskiaceae bacterium]